MAASTVYLGPAGTLVQLPDVLQPAVGYPRTRIGTTHQLINGGRVRDTVGYRRQVTLTFKALTQDEFSLLETLFEQPGPYRFLNPIRRNLLTANQSTGTDARRDTSDLIVNTQGVISSDTAQFHSGTRSIKWDTQTPLGGTGRGVTVANSSTTPDASWAAVLPSTQYTLSMWARASAAVQMKARIDFCDAAGTNLSTINGTPVTLSTSWQQITATGTSTAGTAYVLARSTNSDTPGAAVQVWLDDAQLEQGAAATAWTLGTGVPLVTIDSLNPSSPIPPFADAELVLLEI